MYRSTTYWAENLGPCVSVVIDPTVIDVILHGCYIHAKGISDSF